MRDELTGWGYVGAFTGQQAALAIVGEPQTDNLAALGKASPVLERLRLAYQGALEWFAEGPDRWEMKDPEVRLLDPAKENPAGKVSDPFKALPSVELQRALARIDAATSDMERLIVHRSWMPWLRTSASDFESQTFTREVLARWVAEVNATSLYPFTKPPEQTVLAEASPAQGLPGLVFSQPWTVTTPQRYCGYTAPLHRLLTTALREGRARPTAREVLEEWLKKQPHEIAKVLPDGIDYYDSKGNTKPADLDAIRLAIHRMTSV